MVAMLFLSPSFLYLCRFARKYFCAGIFVPEYLSWIRLVGTSCELCMNGTLGKSSIITFVHFGDELERVPIFSVCVFFF